MIKIIETVKEKSLSSIGAAFAFIIALSWREPISDFINLMITKMGLENGDAISYKVISALVVTIVLVLASLAISYINKVNSKPNVSIKVEEEKVVEIKNG